MYDFKVINRKILLYYRIIFFFFQDVKKKYGKK